MSVPLIAVCIVTVVAVGFMVVADFVRAPFVVANAAAVGVPETWLVPLGVVKGLGALGIIVGLVGLPVLGAMAAAGLVAFFVGAVITHLRARNYALSFPIAYLSLSLFSLAAFVQA